jgi:hypothetical protein
LFAKERAFFIPTNETSLELLHHLYVYYLILAGIMLTVSTTKHEVSTAKSRFSRRIAVELP